MLGPLNDSSEKTDYRGKVFIGKVIDNNDPSFLERVKVNIPGLYEGDAEALPWVAPKVSKGFGNSPGVGVFCVPNVGSWLYVELQDGNPHYPFYTGSPVQIRADLPEADVNYPYRYGFKDARGNVFYVDTTPGQNTIHLRHSAGTEVTIQPNGSVVISCAGPLVTSAPSWQHTGDIAVVGTLTASVDVVAAGKSLVTHQHGGVDTGSGTSGPPV